ncbi:LSM1 [Symbiodinium microadriaticum]|nr:LSM1 [Symbiodinium microadriaticum]
MEVPVFDPDPAALKPGKLPHWASNLEESVDKKLLIVLRDGRKLLGWLRTFDQYANLLVEHIVERHILFEEKVYADIYLGTLLIRGENVCLFGEVDEQEEANSCLQQAALSYVLRREQELEESSGKAKSKNVDLFLDHAD